MAVIPGEGTVLEIGTTSTTTATTQVTSITLGAVEQAAIDTFSLDSTSKTTRASRLPDYGSLSLEGNYDPDLAGHGILRDASISGGPVFIEIGFQSSGDTVTANGYVTSFELSGMEVDSNLTFSCEIKLNALAWVSGA